MFGLILVSAGKAIGLVAGALVVGGILAYAFRGKEKAALASAGNEAKKLASDAEKKL